MSLEKKSCSSLTRNDAAYMKLIKNTLLCFLPIFLLILSSNEVFALNEKPSLKSFADRVVQGEEITNLFKSSAPPDTQKRQSLWLKNQKNLENLENEFQHSATFVRGEIEQESTLSGIIQLLQLSLLQCRDLSAQSKWPEVQNHFSKWFLFAADFPYEESSLVGLRFTSVVRSFLLDDLERIQKKFSSEIAKNSGLRKWFLQVRSPWPVDRIFISEAKRLLQPPMMSVAHSAASAFQKNPYQTSEQALKKVKGGDSQEALLLKKIWQESDILMMKTEITRIGKLQVRLAQAEYQIKNKTLPRSIEELVKTGLLLQAPIDYLSGKPLDLTSL